MTQPLRDVAIEVAYRRGDNVRVIAKRLGCSRHTVQAVRRRRGVAGRREMLVVRDAQIREALARNERQVDLARRYGISASHVCQIAHGRGRKPKGEVS